MTDNRDKEMSEKDRIISEETAKAQEEKAAGLAGNVKATGTEVASGDEPKNEIDLGNREMEAEDSRGSSNSMNIIKPEKEPEPEEKPDNEISIVTEEPTAEREASNSINIQNEQKEVGSTNSMNLGEESLRNEILAGVVSRGLEESKKGIKQIQEDKTGEKNKEKVADDSTRRAAIKKVGIKGDSQLKDESRVASFKRQILENLGESWTSLKDKISIMFASKDKRDAQECELDMEKVGKMEEFCEKIERKASMEAKDQQYFTDLHQALCLLGQKYEPNQ